MAYYRIEYHSNALCRDTSFEMLIPNDPPADLPREQPKRPLRTLFLLHGYCGKAATGCRMGWPPSTALPS